MTKSISRKAFFPLFLHILFVFHQRRGMTEECHYAEIGKIRVLYRVFYDDSCELAPDPYCLIRIRFTNQETLTYNMTEFCYSIKYCVQQYDALLQWFVERAEDLEWFLQESPKQPLVKEEKVGVFDEFVESLDDMDLQWCEEVFTEANEKH